MDQSDLYKTLKNKALQLLARREHASSELRAKLQSADPDGRATEALIEELTDCNYLSDQRYAEMLVRSRYNKGHGPLRIKQEFSQKHLPSELQRSTLDDFEGDWFELAKDVRARRFGTTQLTGERAEDYKLRAKQMRFLAGRGFNTDQIEYAMQNAFASNDDL